MGSSKSHPQLSSQPLVRLTRIFQDISRNLLSNDDLINALIPFSVALHLTKQSRELGLISLFAWLVLQMSAAIRKLILKSSTQATLVAWGGLLGFLLLNARNVIERDDYRGPVQFLLILTGLLISSQFSKKQWLSLLRWLGIAIIPIATWFAWRMHLNDDWSIRSIYRIYYEYTKQSMGSINRLATTAGLLTLSAWYSTTQMHQIPARAASLIIAFAGYLIVLGTGSRMAIIAVPIAISIPWLWMRINNRLSAKQLIITSIATLGLTGSLAWHFVIAKGFASSDVMRLRMASCWIDKGMLKPTERFWIGTGFDSAKLREACEYIRPGSPFGHAHNTLANIAGHHGLLGIIVLISFSMLVAYGLLRQQRVSTKIFSWPPFNSTSWAEISLGLNLTLLIFAASTTIYVSSPINQVLIGLGAGSALAWQSPDQSQ
ncbi:O-antigen ligase [Synechococcus sp. CC9311]|uniref:O-antigen ligase family protein n=1 Tax=Synechococcus sp. (strain CC9311) TaxID=64471 RepID=UPI0000DDA9F6|nr:O-antigen ligase family protein [Synechococcus sp. CC9311]ABI45657.1 hypothetical protein sync_0229 [Synechococcus sp. CC9311]